jgi:phosphatidylserine/phosphatidylglycerophosphate/cardiolipin synthase-like enzyme
MNRVIKCIFLLFIFVPFLYGIPVEDVEVLNNRDYFLRTIEMIKNAEKTIDIAMLEVHASFNREGDPIRELVDALIFAHNKGVKVRLIVESSNWNKNSTRRNSEAVDYLRKHGVTAYFDDPDTTLHAKMLVIDSIYTIIGSTNWSYYAMAQNGESSVSMKSREVAKYYLEKFIDPIFKKSTKDLNL